MLTLALVLITGLTFGSFFNVVGIRVISGQSIVYPPSHCPSCGRHLAVYDLVPVLSYLFLRGRCRTCGYRISPLDPFVEGMTGLLFTICFLQAASTDELITGWLLISLLMIALVTDLTEMMIPDKILLFFLILFAVFRLIFPTHPWWDAPAGAAMGFAVTLATVAISRGGMGGGDVKLFTVLGLLVGTRTVLLGFFLSVVFGACIGALLLLIRICKKRKPIPFVPFIALGMLAAFFFGCWVETFYFTFLL